MKKLTWSNLTWSDVEKFTEEEKDLLARLITDEQIKEKEKRMTFDGGIPMSLIQERGFKRFQTERRKLTNNSLPKEDKP